MAADFYALLGVAPNASDDEIKRAYRQLARELHPDTNPDPTAAERFKEITTAYETLRDPERRRRYDVFGPEGARVAAQGGDPFEGFGLGDIFGAFFGNSGFGGGAVRQTRGADQEIILDLAFEEAVFGGSHEINLRTLVQCDTCGGSGARKGTTPVRCSACDGTGEVRRVRQSFLGQMVTSSPCVRCGGSGEEVPSPCADCKGEGRRVHESAYVVDVPAGVDDGTTLRLTSRGQAGRRGGPPGDLYVHLRVRPSDRFARSGYDLVHELHVPMTLAALGGTVSLETLDGTEELSVAAGTQSGATTVLRGRGVPHVQSRGRGDLIVRLVIDTPVDLDKHQEDLLRQLAEARGESVAPPGGLLSRVRSAFK